MLKKLIALPVVLALMVITMGQVGPGPIVPTGLPISASSVTTTGAITAGTSFIGPGTVASTGTIELANAASINFRNAGNTADVVGVSVDASNNAVIGNANANSVSLKAAGSSNGVVTINGNQYVGPAITITSGFGGATGRSILSQGSYAFQITAGNNGTDTTGVIALPNAFDGWACFGVDQTTPTNLMRQTANSPTSATFTTTAAITSLDKLVGICYPF